ncbi:hypothetical protein F2Q69_00019057 [Brassica cretica]|uniref:Uncharacterized protein n=1 Tax=Brassica cretica TaxID=69181 RepID=A0A8S9QMZ3_BRACR|nr:hypothetical protein F2Q69_00019057 [Brassica cretica]
MHPDMWEEWWRPACVLDIQPDMWSTRCRRTCVRSHAKRHTGCHQPEADWLFSTDFESAPRDGSVQLNSSRPLCSFDDQVEMLSRVSSTGSDQSKFCSILRREVRRTVQELKESSPVQSRRPLGFGQVLSDQPAASRLEHCRSSGCEVDTTGPMPYKLDYEYWDNCVECVLCRQQVRNPPMLGMFWGGIVFPRPRTQRVQGNPLFAGSGRLRRTGSCPMAKYYTTV